jgi:hypothetical protein
MKLFLSNPKADQIKESLFFSGILAIIIIVLWIGVSVYGAYNNNRQADKDIQRLLTPINPTLDLEVLREYQNSRVTPPEVFEIQVVRTEGQEISSYTFNPFTNTTNTVSSPNPEEVAEETIEEPDISE